MSNVKTTPAGKAFWVNAFEPDKKYLKYGCKLVLPLKDAQGLMEQIDEWADESLKDALKQKLTKKRGPLPYNMVLDDEGNETGDVEFTFKQNSTKKDGSKLNVKIGVFDAKGKPIVKPVGIGNGSVVKVAFEANQWANGAQGASVQLRLKGIQVIKLVEYGGGTTADSFGFGEEEGGYEFTDTKATDGNEEEEDESFTEDEEENADF